jgi:hypothetical protein
VHGGGISTTLPGAAPKQGTEESCDFTTIECRADSSEAGEFGNYLLGFVFTVIEWS